jgi:hypothetical protein
LGIGAGCAGVLSAASESSVALASDESLFAEPFFAEPVSAGGVALSEVGAGVAASAGLLASVVAGAAGAFVAGGVAPAAGGFPDDGVFEFAAG